jgi:hypothetical protein
MKILMLLSLLTTSSFLFAQKSEKKIYVDDVEINSLPIRYIRLIERERNYEVSVRVDYGQKLRVADDQKIKDAEGNSLTMKNLVEALNFFQNNGGWKVVSIASAGRQGSGTYTEVQYYVMEKPSN